MTRLPVFELRPLMCARVGEGDQDRALCERKYRSSRNFRAHKDVSHSSHLNWAMANELRKSGIELLGDIPWGTHLCQFFETTNDLLEALVPYFRAGLENNEFCLWIISPPVTRDGAIDIMRQHIPEFDEYLANNRIEILSHVEWYLGDGKFVAMNINNMFAEREQAALLRGFAGMRVTGNETWLQQEDWADFMRYEEKLNRLIADRRMIVLCTYQLSEMEASSVLDVAHVHQHIITKRRGHWEMLEAPGVKELTADVEARNNELEQKVQERTKAIQNIIVELKSEIAEKISIAEELKRSEQRYRTLIEQASDAIIITDDHGYLIEVNSSFCKMVNFREEELIGRDIATLLEPEELKLNPLRFDLLLQGQSICRERLMKKKDGLVFPVEENVKMLEDKRILAIVRDITERKQAETALRLSEDRIRLIINTIPTMAWSLGADGVIDFANKRWIDYAGESQFANPDSVIHPEDAPRVMEKWLENKALGRPFDDELRMRDKHGVYRWFLVRIEPFHDSNGNVIKWYGVSIDIEDNKRAQDELQLAYQSLSYHMENTPLATIEWDKDLTVKRWSKRAEEIFGWTAQEAIGKNFYGADFPIVHEEDTDAVNKIAEDLVQARVERNMIVNRNYTKSRAVVHCEWYNSVLRDTAGKVVTILSLIHDITEREKGDAILKRSYKQIRQLSEHLQNIREQERTHIAREVHDELGGQLTVIKMDVSWLNQKLDTGNVTIRRRVQNLLKLVDATLNAVRRIAGDLRPSLLDNLGLVAAVEWQLKSFGKRSGVRITFKKPKEEPQLSDQAKNGLFRIFQESLTNVARHADAKSIKVELSLTNNQILLSIIDDGRGFEYDKVARDKTLGILGMKERAEMMGGTYTITSREGKGTMVTVNLPLTSNPLL